jgi:hypothetical protein
MTRATFVMVVGMILLAGLILAGKVGWAEATPDPVAGEIAWYWGKG